ncbi:MAG TPA: hypothetical protein DIU35_07625 [Candidatus Latescibacteria bacterium]|nr:hypothetical protein [Gemmatimonadota bacterium]HCR17339.1 hypothetical protein [Candidatus Latescibacterota bacterium]
MAISADGFKGLPPGSSLLEQARSVLLVDDQEEVLTVATSYLSNQGFEVSTTSLWTEAIAQLEKATPDIVLLDLHLPTVQGDVLLEFIREQHPELPVVILSSDINPEKIDELGGLGANGFIRKPFEGDDLLLVMEQALLEREHFTPTDPAELKIELQPNEQKGSDTQSDVQQVLPGSSVETLEPRRTSQPAARRRRPSRKRRGGLGKKIRNFFLVVILFLLIGLLVYGMHTVLSGGFLGIQI